MDWDTKLFTEFTLNEVVIENDSASYFLVLFDQFRERKMKQSSFQGYLFIEYFSLSLITLFSVLIMDSLTVTLYGARLFLRNLSTTTYGFVAH